MTNRTLFLGAAGGVNVLPFPRCDASATGSSPLDYTQGFGDHLLHPAFLVEFPAPQVAVSPPISSLG
jgi:hypothetical protein